MFVIQDNQKYNYSNINITAYRAIKILKMLMEKPCSVNELIDSLQQDSITEKSVSDDTLRLTINSLKSVGCEIARPVPTNNYKYVLISHPFKYHISKAQARILLKIRQGFLQANDWKKVIEINNFYDKIADFFDDEEIKDLLCYKKPFFKINPTVLELLTKEKVLKKEIVFTYNVSSKKTDIVNITAENIFCERGKLYIMGWYPKRNTYSYFNAEKITEIHSVKPIANEQEKPTQKVIYRLNKYAVPYFFKSDDETILMQNSKGCIVEAEVKSEFKIIQRILSFGSDCDVIEPDDFKQKIADKLRKIRARYE
ncbi:MAG: WYL domain-containing protein [Candidatus Gastranaerophilales bacterium]|nr:WYL domain-containing protein [Candidatus Gastranaerophilales bacterium]